MSFLTLNGTTIRSRINATDQTDEEHRLDRERMFDGVVRMTRAGVFRKWSISTALLTTSDRNTVRALVNGGSILTAGGDLVGDDVAVMPVPGTWTPVQTGNGQRWQGKFALMETGGPPPPDTSAVPFAFFRRGAGLKTGTYGDHPVDITTTTPAADGDLVSVWTESRGLNRHLLGGFNNTGVNYDSRFAPVRDGDLVKFGVNPFSSRSRLWGLKDGFTESGWWGDILSGKVDVLIGCRALESPPVSNGTNALWDLSRSGGGSDGPVRFPDANGHVYDVAISGHQHDYGNLSATYDFASLQVYNITGWNSSVGLGSALYTARLGNTVVFTHAETGSFPFLDGLFYVGERLTEYFVGWVRDIVVFDDILTASQRLSWYNYLAGSSLDPPLP